MSRGFREEFFEEPETVISVDKDILEVARARVIDSIRTATGNVLKDVQAESVIEEANPITPEQGEL